MKQRNISEIEKEGTKDVQESKNIYELLEDGRMIRHHGLGEATFNLVPIAIEHQLISFFRGRRLNSFFPCPCFWSYMHHWTRRKSSITRNQLGPAWKSDITVYEEHPTSYIKCGTIVFTLSVLDFENAS